MCIRDSFRKVSSSLSTLWFCAMPRPGLQTTKSKLRTSMRSDDAPGRRAVLFRLIIFMESSGDSRPKNKNLVPVMNTVRQTEISVRLGWERTKYHKRAYRHTRFSISNHIGTAQQGRTNNVLAPEEPDVYR